MPSYPQVVVDKIVIWPFVLSFRILGRLFITRCGQLIRLYLFVVLRRIVPSAIPLPLCFDGLGPSLPFVMSHCVTFVTVVSEY